MVGYTTMSSPDISLHLSHSFHFFRFLVNTFMEWMGHMDYCPIIHGNALLLFYFYCLFHVPCRKINIDLAMSWGLEDYFPQKTYFQGRIRTVNLLDGIYVCIYIYLYIYIYNTHTQTYYIYIIYIWWVSHYYGDLWVFGGIILNMDLNQDSSPNKTDVYTNDIPTFIVQCSNDVDIFMRFYIPTFITIWSSNDISI